ncbi:MAG: NAD-dependent epimerase/dehydratase family protein [Ignavibacteria bacterium]|nr:NAD-dependent epimerase/dehydratase family protein [Ignavibacteria bacterium]
MEVLVTGATGFIGSFVAEYFQSQGFKVRCTVRKTSNLRWVKDRGYQLFLSEFESPESLQNAIEGVDYVVHVAGTIAAKDYNGYLKGNRDSTFYLLKAIEKYNPNIKKFVYCSSQTVVGPAKSLEEPVDETTECKPITSYGQSKLEGEKEVLNFKDLFPITIVRLPAIYGPRDTALVDMFRLVHKGIAPYIGSNDKYLSLLHCNDAVEGLFLATLSEKSTGEIFFLSSEKPYSWAYLIECLVRATGKKTIKIRIPNSLVLAAGYVSELVGAFLGKTPVFNLEKARDFVQKYWVCSGKKAERLLGFQQKVKPEEGFPSTYKWYLENNWI